MGDGWLTAHVVLRTVEWVLDAAGFGPDTPGHADLWRRLELKDTVDALAETHQRREFASFSDDDFEWPLPTSSYVALIEALLGVDFTSLPVRSALQVPCRFAAPN